MKNAVIALSLCIVQLAFISCSSSGRAFHPSKDDMLTPAELSAVMTHARDFITSSIKIKMTDKNKQIIKTTEPKVRTYYTAPKAGRISFTWAIDEGRKYVIVSMEGGDFLSEGRPPWKVMVSSAGEAQYIDSKGRPVKPPRIGD